jgi:GTP cyclohydrolase IA
MDNQPGYDPKLLDYVRTLFKVIGEDPKREGLERTPERHLRALEFLTQGYRTNIDDIVNRALFEAPSNDMVVVRNIELYSMCEHHLLPFFGKAHVAYLPNKKIIGLSKIARVVDHYARRLQVQERLTQEIAQCLMTRLQPLGVGVVIEAHHLCMMMRGVEKQNASTRTSALLGDFRNMDTRSEFLNLIK